MRTLFSGLLLLTLGTLPLTAGDYVSLDIKNPVPEGAQLHQRNYFRVSAGYMYRNLGDARFHTGSRSQNYALPMMFGGDNSRTPGSGSRSGRGSRSYDNGFVFADASGSVDGLTWFWGYQDASQIQNGQLVFSNGGGKARETQSHASYTPGGGFAEEIEEGGPYVQLEYMMGLNDSGSIAWGPQLGFSFIDFDLANTSSTFAAGQSFSDFDVTTTDRYDLGGIIAPLAPYNGTPGGPGPLIRNTPSSRSATYKETDSGSVLFFNKVRESLDVEMYTFSPGISIEFRKNALYLNAAAGLAINVVNWEAHNHETLYMSKNRGEAKAVKKWHDRESDTDILFGAYLQGTVGAQLTEKVSVSAFGRYDWNQDLHGSVGPSSFDADLSGFSAGGMVTLRW